ncbi:MAG TPA: hypothetical protein VMM56_01430, partial [Planctomycetaceae bacterium]|nr:hypothetical protein [Planctomycetaceae bacterium]
MDKILANIDRFTQQLINVLSYPIQHGERIYWLYLLSSLAFALAVYLFSPEFKQNRQEGSGFLKGLFRFLFPSKIWSHKSAWVDVRYFIPHQLVR